MSLVLSLIQEKIQRIYGLSTIPKVQQFLLDDRHIEDLQLNQRPQVVLIPEGDDVQLGVYLGEAMNHANHDLQHYTSIVEEISHFVYLFWNLDNQRQVSLLDIEVQGELDKYLLLADQWGFSEALTIFESYFFRHNLSEEEKERYREASELSQHFIEKIIAGQPSQPELLQYLRELYRKSSPSRISEMSKIRNQMKRKKLVGKKKGW
ncbi:MAG: hypothetical protein KDD46_02980 [Bdellovibrionales bacterium]|nr:hypothetical protein [Bdellovibrionales bacterium]